MFRHILAPVDLSDRNTDALGRVAELAEAGTTRVTLLHVIETIQGVEFEELADFYRELEKKAERALAELRVPLDERGIRCETVVRYGPRAAQIVQFADDNGCDLVVLTSHRISPDRPGGGVGTTSHQVALLVGCAVLLLR
jgi:nucleotide-binding universal stress UspA family protein